MHAAPSGDRVPGTFTVVQKERTVTVELSRRPTPEIPASAEGLAQVVGGTYAALDSELEACFESASRSRRKSDRLRGVERKDVWGTDRRGARLAAVDAAMI